MGLHFTSDWRLAVALVTTAVTIGGLSAAGSAVIAKLGAWMCMCL